MFSATNFEHIIATQIPPELRAYIPGLARIVADIINGIIVGDESQSKLAEKPEYTQILSSLSNRPLPTPSGVVTFAQGNQLGDVGFNDVANNIIKPTMNFHIGITPYGAPANSSTNQPQDFSATIAAYELDNEQVPFQDWSVYAGVGGVAGLAERIRLYTGPVRVVEIKALDTEGVGVMKPIFSLKGRIECKYMVKHSSSTVPNIYLAALPMQETGPNRTTVFIEVGTKTPGDLRNAHSPYRVRRYIPVKHYSDGRWHKETIDFDFRDTPTAAYSLFAPRINEGCPHPGSAHLFIREVCIYLE